VIIARIYVLTARFVYPGGVAGQRDQTTVPQALGRLRVAMDRAFLEASRAVGLTAQQAELLCAAMRPDPVTDLARALRRDHSTISRLADRAAKRGLLQRRGQDQDGRVSVIELTAEGERRARAFLGALEASTQPLLAGWSERRKRDAVALLTELSVTLEALTERPGSEDADDGLPPDAKRTPVVASGYTRRGR
jgi:DNA-binding MarR family transcriptional regulator